jgi:DNA repair protein RecO (recombination protein O)
MRHSLSMDFADGGIILGVRAHGESSCVVHVLTMEHGLHSGLVQGGRSKKHAAMLQIGNGVEGRWRARLSEHLGRWELEPVKLRMGHLLDEPACLEAVRAACQLCLLTLPERQASREIHGALDALIEGLVDTGEWQRLYVHWELGFLGQIGFGLDLRRCAVSGEIGTITHVSPKSGRGVNADHPDAIAFRDKLLPVPGFLLGSQVTPLPEDYAAGLRLGAHFLSRWVLWPASRDMPDARARLAELLGRQSS